MGSDDDNGNRLGVSHKIMLVAIFSLFAVLMLIILLHLYARYVLRRQERRRRAFLVRSIRAQIIPIDATSEEPPPQPGLDPLVIASLPNFTYKLDHSDESIECSVCLSSLKQDAMVRLLPNCKHMFHAECVDKWLGSHTTCPVCRAEAEPRVQSGDKEAVMDTATTRVQLQPTAPPIDQGNYVSHGAEIGSSSGSWLGSFRRILNGERPSSRIQSRGDEIAVQDSERQWF